MQFKRLHLGNKGFTLVELVVAMTIFAIMSTMTILIYFNVSETSRRLQISREISETAREITERIAEDVKKSGISLNAEFSPNTTHAPWKNTYSHQYTKDGSEVLAISDTRFYAYGRLEGEILLPCGDNEKNNITTHCGLYLVTRENWNIKYQNLVDSFRADENQKRVKITDLKFYISGDDTMANKATLRMTLQLMPRAGVPASLINGTRLDVQTTFSERFYKVE